MIDNFDSACPRCLLDWENPQHIADCPARRNLSIDHQYKDGYPSKCLTVFLNKYLIEWYYPHQSSYLKCQVWDRRGITEMSTILPFSVSNDDLDKIFLFL